MNMNINDFQNLLNEFYSTNEKSKNSLRDYFDLMLKIKSQQRLMNKNVKLKSKLEKEIEEINNRVVNSGNVMSKQDKALLKLKQNLIKEIERQNKEISAQVQLHQTTNKVLHGSLALISTTERVIINIGKSLVKNSAYYLEQMKSVRSTEKSMGMLLSQTDMFRQHMYETSVYTNMIGVDTKKLAEMQNTFSEVIGRNLVLSGDNLKSLANMEKGTNVSLSHMTEMLGVTNSMGKNVTDVVNSFESLSNKSSQMGLNQLKVYNKLNQVLKFSNKFTFKDGLESMKKMALYSERYKTNVDEIASFADKVFDIEGAINMGAQLQVLGGKWAQISDPMSLLFKARNDMDGLQDDIIKAASQSAQWDSVTKQFKISALELHRLRGASEITGMSLDHLRDMAEKTASSLHIKNMLGSLKLKDEEYALIEGLHQMNSDGTFSVNLNGKDINSKDLYKYTKEISQLVKEQATFEDRAKNAMVFDEKASNLINTLKSTALPIFEAFDGVVSPLLDSFGKWLKEGGTLNALTRTMSIIGKTTESILKFVISNPVEAIIGASVAVGSKVLFEIAKWRLMGMEMRRGFDSLGTIAGGGSVGGSGKMGRFKGAGLGIGMGLAGAGMGVLANSSLVDQGSDAQQALSVGGTALSWAGTAAMIGSMIAPGIGTAIGGVVGGLAGGIYQYLENKSNTPYSNINDDTELNIARDFIARPGEKPIKFSSADSLVGFKKDGGIGKALLGNNDSSPKETKVSFSNNLKIDGTIELKSNGNNVGKVDLNDPVLMRELTSAIQKQISISLSGGKNTNSRL